MSTAGASLGQNALGIGMTVMAFSRVAESLRPAEERLFDDRFSRVLLPGVWQLLLLPGLRHALLALAERRGPGALGNLYCRTRYIDQALHSALERGVAQVVILGAGFDARPYRIPGAERAHVFELDLPPAQELKKARLQQALGTLPSHVTFVPIDFDRQSLGEVLTAAGYRAGASTFFIWEGVTQYITAGAVDATFHYIARTGAGNEVVFTYVDRGIIDGSARSATDERLVAGVRRGGMPWIFGLDPAEVEAYLAGHRLTFVEEAWAPTYQARYLEPRGRRMNVFAGERVVLARVATNQVDVERLRER
jgi:methyltransferase (TIGR00027 family)